MEPPLYNIYYKTAEHHGLKQEHYLSLLTSVLELQTKVGVPQIFDESGKVVCWIHGTNCLVKMDSALSRLVIEGEIVRTPALLIHTISPVLQTLPVLLVVLLAPACTTRTVASRFLRIVKRVYKARKATFMWKQLPRYDGECELRSRWFRWTSK